MLSKAVFPLVAHAPHHGPVLQTHLEAGNLFVAGSMAGKGLRLSGRPSALHAENPSFDSCDLQGFLGKLLPVRGFSTELDWLMYCLSWGVQSRRGEDDILY